MLFYYFFIFASIVLGTFNIGPFSIRVYMTAIMAIFLFTKYKVHRTYKIPKKFLLVFLLYLIVVAVALSLNGEYAKYDYTKLLLSRYLNCIITFFATDYFIKDEKLFNKIIIVLISILTFNCIVTLFQYMGSPLGRAVALFLITSDEVKEEIASGQSYDMASLFGEDLTIGIFNYSFINANVIAVVGVLIIGCYSVAKKFYSRVILLSLLPLFLFACLATQSRTPFILFFLFSIYLLYKKESKNAVWVLSILFFIAVILINLQDLIDSGSLGRILDSQKYENDPRKQIWADAQSFLEKNLLLGGPIAFLRVNPLGAHNYFLNGFITGGLFGGLIASILYIQALWYSLRAILNKNSLMLSSLGASLLIYLINSLFHNASIISGDTIFFLLFTLMLKATLFEKKDNKTHLYETNNNCRSLRHRKHGLFRRSGQRIGQY